MKSVWWTRRAVTLHVALLVAVPLFLALGLWQLHRALGGNMLSWAYTFEWPFFAGYATWMWWRLVHEETAPAGPPKAAAARGASARVPREGHDPYDEADPELAAYNRYLASLHEAQPEP